MQKKETKIGRKTKVIHGHHFINSFSYALNVDNNLISLISTHSFIITISFAIFLILYTNYFYLFRLIFLFRFSFFFFFFFAFVRSSFLFYFDYISMSLLISFFVLLVENSFCSYTKHNLYTVQDTTTLKRNSEADEKKKQEKKRIYCQF